MLPDLSRSRWEIHREDMTRLWTEMDRQRREADGRWRELQEKANASRTDYDTEMRRFNREVLLRMEKTYANLNATLVYVGEELAELKAAVNAQTEAIMKLVDRFEEWEKRQLG
jgi:histidinol phosphatase-like enzyme